MVAFDSRCTQGGDIVTDDFNKHYKRNGVDYIIAGAPADVEVLIAMYENPDLRATPEILAIVIDEGKVFDVCVTAGGELTCLEVYFNIGIGSGYQWALAALDQGCTPKQAIKYAASKDAFTGGKIRTIKVG
jgi:ATP-dependent protease HslVU (ClpYQ) peptidase subunit